MAYLDFNATTPLDPRVRESFLDALEKVPGNASSRHHASGRRAAEALSGARERTAGLLGVSPREVLFTSGATEAVTLAILGLLAAMPAGDRTIVIGATEHKAVSKAAAVAHRLLGARVVQASVDCDGIADLAEWAELLPRGCGLAAMMLVNNETGVVSPVAEMAEVAHQRGVTVLCDLTQGVGKVPVDLGELGVDVAALSGHKFYGPKGTGALVATRQLQRSMVPVLPGGGQEHGLRGGTHNTPALVALGVAAELAAKEAAADADRLGILAEQMTSQLVSQIHGASVVAASAPKVRSTISLHVSGAEADEVLNELVDVEISTGSACTSGTAEPSHVLLAMGLDPQQAAETLRISLGRPTVWADCATGVAEITKAVEVVRARHSEGGRDGT